MTVKSSLLENKHQRFIVVSNMLIVILFVIHLALPSQIIGTLFPEMPMSVAFEARDSLRGLRLLPIFPLEVLFLLFETWEFSLLSKFSILLELQEFSKILHKICHIFLDPILIR